MGIFFFVIGTLLIVGLGALTTFRVKNKNPEEHFYGSFVSIIIMSFLTVVFYLWGDYAFSQVVYKWLLFSFSVIVLIFITFYFLGYTVIAYNDFEARLFLLIIPALIEVFFIYVTFINIEFVRIFLLKNYEWLITIISILICMVTTPSSIINSKQRRESEKKIRAYQRNLRFLSSDPDLESFYFNSSRGERAKLEEAIIGIYTMLQEDRFTPSRVFEYLRITDIQSDLSRKIVQRLLESGMYRSAPIISLLEFSQEILPEYFRPDKYSKNTSRNSSMDIRMFEDIYDRFRRLVDGERTDLSELNKKVDLLTQTFIADNVLHPNKEKPNLADETSCQNQIRELFHALETPIASSELAVSNLQRLFSELTEEQKNKLIKIQNNLKLIKCVLYAYRELTFLTIRDTDNVFLPLPEIINSIKDFISEQTNDIIIEIKNLPDAISNFSTNIITILTLPLIQNAIEATPKGQRILISYTEDDQNHMISISNYCTQLPNQVNLEKEGYSSKGNNHVGSGISIVKRISSAIGIIFTINVNNNQVVASLKLPKPRT